MRVVSWNVGEKGLAGLAAAQREGAGLRAVFAELGNPAIVALQETKLAGPEKLTAELANVPGYSSFFSYCTAATGVSLVRTGYAGTGTYVRHDVATLAAAPNLGSVLTGASAQHTECESDRLSPHLLKLMVENDVDSEGRALLTDHGAFVLVNVYCPAFGREGQDGRSGYKRRFHEALSQRCRALLRQGRQILLVGDLNVIALPIDASIAHRAHSGGTRLPHPEDQQRQPQNLIPVVDDLDEDEEKEWSRCDWFHSQLQPSGPLVDCFRDAWPTRQGAYTFWPTVSRARETNTGSRLDYILASSSLHNSVINCDIQPEVMGSDHCPIWVELQTSGSGAVRALKDPPSVSQPSGTMNEQALTVLEVPRLKSLPPLCSMHLKRLRTQQTDLARYWKTANALERLGADNIGHCGVVSQIPPQRPAQAAERTRSTSRSKRRRVEERRGGIEAFLNKRSSHVSECTSSTRRTPALAAKSLEGNGVLDDDAALAEAIRRSLDDSTVMITKSNELVLPFAPASKGAIAAAEAPVPHRIAAAEAKLEESHKGGHKAIAGRLGGAWNSIFRINAARAAPRCFHNEPATSYETKDKKSEHFGRRFWACDDKRHPKGDWHSNPFPDNHARCPFFLWSQSHRGFVARNMLS